MDSSLYALYFTLLAAWALGVQAVNVEGTLEVQTLSSNIESLLGCSSEAFICEGVGNAVEWKEGIPGRRPSDVAAALVTTEVDDTGTKVRSSLVFPPNVSTARPTQYTCIVKGGPISSTLEASLTVRNTIVYIKPITDIDISDKSVGETLSFECSVFTCQENIEIAILKGSQLLTVRNFPDGKDLWVPVSLTISEDTADTYRCLAKLPDGAAFNETFRITGTPRRNPTISNPFPDDSNPGNPHPFQDSTTRPSTSRRGSACFNSPHIQIIVSLLVLFLVAVSIL